MWLPRVCSVPDCRPGIDAWLSSFVRGFEWIGTVPAVILFASAAIVEVAAFYVPWIDNALDSIATPAAVIAGIIAAVSVMSDLPPLLRWAVALIGGGGAAGAVQGVMAVVRMGSTVLTGGIGNGVVSTGEWVASVVTSLLAILLPLAGIAFVFLVIVIGWRSSMKRKEQVTTQRSQQ